MSAFTVAFNAVIPIFLMIVLGFGVKKLGYINQDFVSQASKFVFRICLPILVFRKVASIELHQSFELSQIYLMLFCVVSIFLAFFISKGVSKIGLKEDMSERGYVVGAFIQGSFRSNYLIIGYPVLLNLFGDAVVVNMALVTLVVIPMFNVLSIVALTPPDEHNGFDKYKKILLNVVKNPLIISIVLGFSAAAIGIKLPTAVDSFLAMAAGLATPLALVAIGAFFHFDGFKETIRPALLSALVKLIILPVIMTTAAYLAGLEPMNIILVGILFGGPTAVSSFAMSSELGGDPVVSGNIVILSSALCVVTYMTIITFWLTVLNMA